MKCHGEPEYSRSYKLAVFPREAPGLANPKPAPAQAASRSKALSLSFQISGIQQVFA